MPSAPVTVAAALRWPGLDPVDILALLQHVLHVNHAYLIAHSERTLTRAEQSHVEACFARRLAGEPVAYIVGRREFYGRDFIVSPAVLVPRAETELAVELALERMQGMTSPRVLDLGTGSGCIGITIGLERPDCAVVAVDASDAALGIAVANADALGSRNVSFVNGSWLEPIANDAFDVIVGNPPYVADTDPHLIQGDLRFEPRSALAAGAAGLDEIAAIVASAPRRLRRDGWLLLEHGWDQAEAVANLLAGAGLEDCFLLRDLAGQPRVSGGRRSMRR